ncbi:hypothetical protein C8Q72DRAFT_955244 [Fomitopsis betulina]|nr:hypothetical protein C8Q72DRAFT_955244 [Fomitopsis betulina]
MPSSPLVPSEEVLNAAFKPNYRILCHVDVYHLVDAARRAFHLDPSLAPDEVRLLNRGSFNKVFFIRFNTISVVARVPYDEPAARDPIRLSSQVATLCFLQSHRPSVPAPRLITASPDSTNPSRAPYIITEFCSGTSIGIREWYNVMSDAARSSLIDLLADVWVKITAPVPFTSIGSLLCEPSTAPGSGPQAIPPSAFRVIPMIPQCPDDLTGLIDPSTLNRPTPRTLLEHWTHELDVRRQEILSRWPETDLATGVVWKDVGETYTLEEVWQCFRIVQELVAIVAPLAPLADASAMALVHTDFSFWKNILFSDDRTRVEGVVDWDDAVIVPRDLAALYPDELTHEARWRCDPADVFAIPPGTLFEDEGTWGVAIQETEQRRLWREAIQKRDPELAAMYTDRRARLRRKVQYLVTGGCGTWMSRQRWLTSESLAEARAIAEGVEVLS